MKRQFIVIEYDILKSNKEISVIFGPFKNRVDADEFCNRRIATLSDEWYSPEDGAIIDHINWEIHECNPVELNK